MSPAISGLRAAQNANIGLTKHGASAEEVLSKGNDLLHKVLNNPSEPCQGDLNALQGIGVSTVGILAISDTVDWRDATNGSTLAIGLFSPSDPNYAFYQQHLNGVSIAKYVSKGTTAKNFVSLIRASFSHHQLGSLDYDRLT